MRRKITLETWGNGNAASLLSENDLMAILAPPPAPPPVAVYDNDNVRRFRHRLFQVLASIVTILLTGWICTYGAIPAIIALMVAKHVLVAILMWGLDVDARG
jgi:hypothetical protein